MYVDCAMRFAIASSLAARCFEIHFRPLNGQRRWRAENHQQLSDKMEICSSSFVVVADIFSGDEVFSDGEERKSWLDVTDRNG